MSGPRWGQTGRTQATRTVDGTVLVSGGPGVWSIPGTPFQLWDNETERVWVLVRLDADGTPVGEAEYVATLKAGVRAARRLTPAVS